MSQQINLFDPSLRKRSPLLSLLPVILAVLVVGNSMAVYALFERQRLGAAELQLVRLTGDIQQARDRLARAGAQSKAGPNKTLLEEIARAEARGKIWQDLLEKVTGTGIGSTEGYSKYLAALARQRVDGVWLTGIRVAGSGAELVIEGRALRAELLPEYIRMLNREDVFRGMQIGEMKILEVNPETAKPSPGSKEGSGASGERAAALGDTPRIRYVSFAIGSAPLPARN